MFGFYDVMMGVRMLRLRDVVTYRLCLLVKRARSVMLFFGIERYGIEFMNFLDGEV